MPSNDELRRLRESEARFRSMVEVSPNSVLVVQDDRYVFANPAGARRLGYADPADVVGVDVFDTLAPEHHAEIRQRLAAVHEGGANPSRRMEIVLPDGSRRWIESTSVATTWEGRPAALVIGRDMTAERQAEHVLRLHETIVRNISDAIFVTDDTGRLTYVCPNVDVIFGWTMEQVLAMGRIDEVIGRLPVSLDDLAASEELHNVEHLVTDRHGDRHHLLLTIKRVSIGDGTLMYVCRDVSDRVQAEAALRSSEERLRLVVEGTNDGIWDWVDTSDPEAMWWSPRFYELLGYEVGAFEPTLERFLQLLHPDDRGASLTAGEALRRSEQPFESEYRLRHRSGEYRWFRARGVAMPAAEGRPGRLAGSVRDITEEMELQERLRREKEQAQRYLDLAGVVFVALDTEGRVQMVNRRAEELLGWSADELVGRDWFDSCLPERSRDEVRPAFDDLMRGELEPVEYFENSIVNREGRERTIAWHNTLLRDDADAITGTLSSGEDVTEQRRAEAALRESERLLNATGEMARVGGWEVDVERGIPYWTQATRRIHEVPDDYQPTLEEAIEFFPGENKERITMAVRRAMEHGEPYELELDFVTATGRPRRVRTRGVPEMRDGRCVRLWGIFQDITDQHRAERSLRDALQRTERILESISDGFFALDPDLVVTYYNAAAEQLLGRSREEVLGRRLFDAFPETRGSIFEEEFRRALRAGETRSFETCFDVEPLVNWYDVNVYPFEDGISVFFRVVTEQKRLEEALLESEARYRAIFEDAVVGVFQSAPDGGLLDVNPAFAAMFGYSSPEEMVAQVHDAASQLYADPSDRARMQELLDSEGRVTNHEVRFKTRRGREFWALMNTQAIRDEQGGIQRYEGTAVDVTERHRAVRQLAESRAMLQAAMDCSPAGIAIADAPDGRLRYVNRAGLLIRGGTPDEVVEDIDIDRYVTSWRLYDVDGERPLERDEVPLARALMYGERCSREFVIRRAEEDDRTVLASAAPILDADGRVTAAVVVFHDFTDRLRLEEQLRALAAELSAVEERERRALATFLHDRIGQSLAVLRMRFGDISRRLGDSEVGQRVESMRDLLERAIEETQSLTFQLSPPILYELGLEPALEWVGEQVCREHRLEFSFSDDGRSKPLEEDVAPLLYRSVRELLLNVVKHARASRVEVDIGLVGDRVRIAVADDGSGFDVGNDSLVEPMTHFGLFSVRERLGAIGGRISIDSAPGEGTRVVLEVPARSSGGRDTLEVR